MINSRKGIVSKSVIFICFISLFLSQTESTLDGLVEEVIDKIESFSSKFKPTKNVDETMEMTTDKTMKVTTEKTMEETSEKTVDETKADNSCSVAEQTTDEKSEGEIDLSHYGDRMYGEPDEAVGMLVGDWEENEWSGNPEELGSYLEGDILFPRSLGRNFRVDKAYYWPNGVVPFVIYGNFDANELSLLANAMKEFHDKTCIKFVPWDMTNENYINIESTCTGCWSAGLGCLRQGNQTVNLQTERSCVPPKRSSCFPKMKKGTAVHELMHVVGFAHEQNRFDRDDYIEVLNQNIEENKRSQFQKVSNKEFSTFETDYDYNSIMHYGDTAFSKDQKNLKSMKAKKPLKRQMGRGDTFTAKDLTRVRGMYKCKETTTSIGYKLPPLRISRK